MDPNTAGALVTGTVISLLALNLWWGGRPGRHHSNDKHPS